MHGQLRGDKECPLSGVTKSGKSSEEGAGKRCSESAVDTAYRLVTLSLTINETLKWLSSLPILMQESFWW